jgi:hypothetical protein
MYTVLTVYDRIRLYTTVYWFITSYISFARRKAYWECIKVAQALMQAAFNQDIEGLAGPAMCYGFPSGAFAEIRVDNLWSADC